MALTISGSGGGIPPAVIHYESGSYTGDGSTRSSSNPLSITFSGTPILVWVYTRSANSTGRYRGGYFFAASLNSSFKAYGYNLISYSNATEFMEKCYAKLNGKTLSWYYDGNYPAQEFNYNNDLYEWIALCID